MASIGYSLNKTVNEVLTLANLLSDNAFVAVNIDATVRPVILTRLELGVDAISADAGNLQFVLLRIFRNASLNEVVTLTTQIQSLEVIYKAITNRETERVISRILLGGLYLEKGFNYAVLGTIQFGGFTGPDNLFLTVGGDYEAYQPLAR